MRRLLGLTPIWLLLGACDGLLGDPCNDYVDYVCDCHADDLDYDCETIRLAHENHDVEQYEDCQLELDRVKVADAASGFVCATGDTGGDTSTSDSGA